MTDGSPDLVDQVGAALLEHQRRETHANLARLMAPPRPRRLPEEPREPPSPPVYLEDVICSNCGCETVYPEGGCASCGHLPHRQHWTGRPPAERRTDFVKLLGLQLCQVQRPLDRGPADFETVEREAQLDPAPWAQRLETAPLLDAVSDRAVAELGAVTFKEHLQARGLDLEGGGYEPNPHPFAHLPPWSDLRAAAYRRWPDPRFWRSPTRYEEAKRLAGGA